MLRLCQYDRFIVSDIKISKVPGHPELGETSKFNPCGPSFPHSLTEAIT